MKKIILIVMLILFSGVNVWAKDIYYCPMHPHYTSDKPGDCPICNMKLVKKRDNAKVVLQQQMGETKKEKKILYYRNPMNSSVTSPTFIKDSMGMDYIPVYEEQNTQEASSVEGYATISASAQKQQLIGVRTAIVGKKSVIKTIRAGGRVAYDPDLYKAETDYVEAYINYTRLNRRVNKGSYVMQDSLRKLKEAELDLVHMGATEQTIAQLHENKLPDHSLLVAHQGGGQVFAEVFGSDLGFIDVGQKAIVEVPDLHQRFEGNVQSIDPVIDPVSRTTRVRIYVNTKSELHSNMFVRVQMPVELNEAIVVPRDAVMDTGVRKVVFVQKDEGVFEPREIETGWETDEGFEVKSGLKEGERIVVSGNFLLDSESRIQAGLENTIMTPAERDSHGQ